MRDRKGASPPTPSRLLNFSGPVAEGGEASHLTSPFLSTEKANKRTFCTKQPGTHHITKVFDAEDDKSSRYEGKKASDSEPGGRGYRVLRIKHHHSSDNKASAEEKTLCHLLRCENGTLF